MEKENDKYGKCGFTRDPISRHRENQKKIRNEFFMISHHSGFGPNKYGSTSSAHVNLSSSTLPKTNSSPLEIGWAPKGNSSTNH